MKVLEDINNSQLKLLNSEFRRFDDLLNTLTISVKKFSSSISSIKLEDFNSGIIQLSGSLITLKDELNSVKKVQTDTNESLDRYRDTMKKIDDFLANSFLKQLERSTGSVEIFGINIVDVTSAIMDLLGALYSFATFLAVVKTLSGETFNLIMSLSRTAFSLAIDGVAALGRAFISVLGPGSAEAGVVI